ncbi:DNA (cytosine-5-)-methyltransferase [Streptomyces sp. NEAU-sy36]|uniref:DNA (cytosine-5-)-methyltransferase n=1 Tax=unclassified Streptomyces TaxID=2593676 RepID=UPI0015D5D4B7|nr:MULTISPECIES: DNA (cytosine-5-)-methyltransferase [unclassified Streptomyces]QLJ04938.1 DNA (cytosine-5-)-methyltransferase [Streptomyces sp. NEAU-sy36]
MLETPGSVPSRPLTAIDLFCGAGGLTQGFKSVGFDVKFALDLDQDSCATYKLNHPEVEVECASITDFTPEEIAWRAGGQVDVVIGGPSCQGFSTAGRRTRWVDEADERNALWKHMLAVVSHLRPRAFLMENVPGMVYWRDGQFGKVILEEFEKLGYSVSKDILLAADYGVPQRRRRLFIVGILGDGEFQFPQPTHMGGWRRDTLHLWEKKRKEKGLLKHLTVWDAIGDLPPIEDGSGLVEQAYGAGRRSTPLSKTLRNGARVLRDHEVQPLSDEYKKLLSHVPIGGTWRDIPPYLLPDRYRGMRRTDSTNLLGRLDPKLPSYTITTQFSNVTTGCNTHPYEERPLSVREGARLQTFPDTYRFVGNLTSKCRQIGNAVPVQLAAVLASAIASSVDRQVAVAHHQAPSPVKPARVLPLPRSAAEDEAARSQRRGAGDGAEVELRANLRTRGLAHAADIKPLAGMPRVAHIAFDAARVAVFVNGCFWYGCPEHARATKSNTKWWADNIAENKRHDEESTALLVAAGWQVLHVWEHEDPTTAADRIVEVVREALSRAELVGVVQEAV